MAFNNSYIYLIATIVGIIIISLGFKGMFKRKLLLSVMCFVIMFVIDFTTNFIIININRNIKIGVYTSFVSIFLFYMAILIIKLLLKNKLKTGFSEQWYILLVVSVMSAFLLYIICRDINIAEGSIVAVSFIILILNFLLYIFYFSMLDRFEYEQENRNLKQQMNLYEQQIRNNVENDTEIKAIRHDMKHHIRVIKDLADMGNVDEIKEYVEALDEDIQNIETYYNTGNIAVDGILNYYSGLFKEKGISTDINIAIPENMDVNAYDLNIILGNLMDNSLENAVKADKPSVSVSVKCSGCVLHIAVTNTYDGMVEKKGGSLLSRKSGSHGFGVDNVKKIVKKYAGEVKVDYDKETFSVRIVMYI
ncbi:MAG: GHKL domain-containing protein [Eubacteriales bacterium]|nr:GHKL domain-containing protein [Eubacteriales bacterium]